MARVQLIEADQAPLLARPYYAGGDPGPIAKALAQVPEQMPEALAFFGRVLGASALADRPKEIVVLRTSAAMSCRYCIQAHTVVALDAGLTADEVRGLRGELPLAACFPEVADRALIDYVDAVASATAVRDDITGLLLRHVPEYLVVEITLCAATTLLLNRFCTALELPTAADTLQRLRSEGFA
jgi:AhpD family alkylhydroperoxidase